MWDKKDVKDIVKRAAGSVLAWAIIGGLVLIGSLIFQSARDVLFTAVPIPILIVVLLLLAVVVLAARVVHDWRRRKQYIDLPADLVNKVLKRDELWRAYTMDPDIFDVVWRWKWLDSGEISDLRPFCPRCDLELTLDTSRSIQVNNRLGNPLVCLDAECSFGMSPIAVTDPSYELIRKHIYRNARQKTLPT